MNKTESLETTPLTIMDLESAESYMLNSAPIREEKSVEEHKEQEVAETKEEEEVQKKPEGKKLFKNYELFEHKSVIYEAETILKGLKKLGYDTETFPRDADDFCAKLDIDVRKYTSEENGEIGRIVKPDVENQNLVIEINENEAKSANAYRINVFLLAVQWILVESKDETFTSATYKTFKDNVLNYTLNLVMPLKNVLEDIRSKHFKADEIAKIYGVPKAYAQRKTESLGF